MKNGFIRLGKFLVAFFLVIPVYSVSAGDSNEILLKSRRFIPRQGITAAAKATIKAIPERAHVLIQLERIPTNEERKELEAKGIRLLSYIPNKAWLASIPSGKAGEITAISNVRAISEILPEDKISPHITAGEFLERRVRDGKADFIVEFFKDVSFAEIDEVIQRHNGRIVGRVPSLNAVVAVMQIEESVYLGFEESVKWIEQELPLKPANDGARAAVGVDAVQAPPYNLNGNNIGVIIYDDGLVDKTHSDFGDRVIWGGGGYLGNHATHAAGTLGGDGSGSEAKGGTPLQWRGMAPAVNIISYCSTCPSPDPCICLYNDSASMADMENNFNDGIANYGADIGTASVDCQPAQWEISCSYEGDYSPHAQLIDTIIYNKSIPITWAAGNERGGEGWCGYTYNTICPTATGKNAIIVGAINSNDDSMPYFSSWGPTDDGRIKPDVVAPGCEGGGDKGITSTALGNTYSSACGTSYATPVVAGSVALLLEDWKNTHRGQPNPLPSTIKAVLLQTAVDLGNPGPDYSYGYGKINVKDAIDLINAAVEGSIIDQNDKDQFTITVLPNQPELKITLVWDDYPGEPVADKTLVNDLDLIVKDPNGTRYYPWILNPSCPNAPATRGEDHTNNVEQVYVENPFSGTWTIEIKGFDVPKPAQNYSLVWNRKFFSLSKVDVNEPNCVIPGDYVTYTISYANPPFGDPDYIGDVNDVVITDYLSDDVVFSSASGLNGVYHPGTHTVTWDIGTLGPNDSGSVTLTVKVNDCITGYGVIRNSCIIKGGNWTFGRAYENTPVCNASHPNPACGEIVDLYTGDSNLNLTWCQGHFAADVNGHEVYFGTNSNDVNDANNSWPIGEVYKGPVTKPSYPLPFSDLNVDTTYYWRIDEVNTNHQDVRWRGDVWSFTTCDYLVVENFNSYASAPLPNAALRAVWKDWTWPANGTYAAVYADQTTVHSGLSMKYEFMNYTYEPYYSEATATIGTGAGKLHIDPNWLDMGAKVLSLWFYGQQGNDANQKMYVTLTDGASKSAKIIYYGDMNDIREPQWHQWNIVLQDFVDDNDVNLANVSRITIGFGNGTQAASDGTVYFEDIRLYLRKCFPGYYPVGDFEPDCAVDFYDFAIFARAWLTSSGQPDYNPVCDISVPRDGIINEHDLARFCDYWLWQEY